MAKVKKTGEQPAPEQIREGDPQGSASVFYSPDHRACGHLNTLGEFVAHQAPEGFRYSPTGELKPLDEQADEEMIDG